MNVNGNTKLVEMFITEDKTKNRALNRTRLTALFQSSAKQETLLLTIE